MYKRGETNFLSRENYHLCRLPGRKASVGMVGSSRLTEERVDIIYKVELSQILKSFPV